MDLLLVASAAFIGGAAVDVVFESTAEIYSNWNHEWMKHYFWDIKPDKNGSEAQRLAATMVARIPVGEGYEELCSLPLTTDGRVAK